MTYTDTFKKFLLTEVVTNDPDNSTELEEDEMSTTSDVGGYDTPNAFGVLSNDTIEMLGYKKVPKKKLQQDKIKESSFKILAKELYITNICEGVQRDIVNKPAEFRGNYTKVLKQSSQYNTLASDIIKLIDPLNYNNKKLIDKISNVINTAHI